MNTIDSTTTAATLPPIDASRTPPAVALVDQQQVDAVLLEDMAASKALTASITTGGLPQLPQPPAMPQSEVTGSLREFVALPSPMGTVLALITEQSGEQRRMNKEMMIDEVKATVADMRAEAKKMVTKAVVSLVMGVVSSAVSIASGAMSLGTLGKSMKSGVLPKDMQFDKGKADGPKAKQPDKPKDPLGNPDFWESADFEFDNKGHEKQISHKPPEKPKTALDSGQIQALAVRISAVESLFGSASSVLKSIGDTTAGIMDSQIQGDEASIETEKAMRDALQATNDALNDLIHRALETYDSIQQNVNQTRTKILS